jgi:hypothetical protein
MIAFNELMDAFLFVSSERQGMHTAILCMETGQIYYRSELGGIDETDDDDLDQYSCIEIPHKNDLGLGRDLVFEFVETRLPGYYDRVQRMFEKRGAYGRCKDFLESKGLLESWYQFENQREETAIRQWCAENQIEISESPRDTTLSI